MRFARCPSPGTSGITSIKFAHFGQVGRTIFGARWSCNRWLPGMASPIDQAGARYSQSPNVTEVWAVITQYPPVVSGGRLNSVACTFGNARPFEVRHSSLLSFRFPPPPILPRIVFTFASAMPISQLVWSGLGRRVSSGKFVARRAASITRTTPRPRRELDVPDRSSTSQPRPIEGCLIFGRAGLMRKWLWLVDQRA
jgi:hypothetical protein